MNCRRLGTICVFGLMSCGISNPQYVDYTPEVPAVTSTPDCPDGLAAYQENMAGAVDGTCSSSSCHAATKVGKGNLVKGSDAANRTALLSYADTDGSTLFGKISSQSHGGGDQSKTLALEKIQAWKTIEANCPKASLRLSKRGGIPRIIPRHTPDFTEISGGKIAKNFAVD